MKLSNDSIQRRFFCFLILLLLLYSNNNVQDSGVGHISDGLIEQRHDEKYHGKGLGILVLWNNHITRNASQHFSRAIVSAIILPF